jgi:hypothetical protein
LVSRIINSYTNKTSYQKLKLPAKVKNQKMQTRTVKDYKSLEKGTKVMRPEGDEDTTVYKFETKTRNRVRCRDPKESATYFDGEYFNKFRV